MCLWLGKLNYLLFQIQPEGKRYWKGGRVNGKWDCWAFANQAGGLCPRLLVTGQHTNSGTWQRSLHINQMKQPSKEQHGLQTKAHISDTKDIVCQRYQCLFVPGQLAGLYSKIQLRAAPRTLLPCPKQYSPLSPCLLQGPSCLLCTCQFSAAPPLWKSGTNWQMQKLLWAANSILLKKHPKFRRLLFFKKKLLHLKMHIFEKLWCAI